MSKPQEILDLEKHLGFELNEVDSTESPQSESKHGTFKLDIQNTIGQLCLYKLSKKRIPFLDEKSYTKTIKLIGSSFPSLSFLQIRQSELDDISFLDKLPKITQLNLELNQILDLSPLSNMHSLEDLNLKNNNIRDITPITSLTSIKKLNLADNNLLNIKEITFLKNIESLVLSNNTIVDLEDIINLPNLQSLELDNTQHQNYAFVFKTNNIKALSIANNNITNLKFIPSNNHLIKLNLSYNKGISLRAIKENTFNDLRELSLKGTNINNYANIKIFKNLEYLDISQNNITNINFIQELSNLKYLNLDGNSIQNIKPLSYLKNLATVILPQKINAKKSGIPEEVINAGWQAIKDYFNSELIEIKSVKILLLGNTNIGKSTLLKYWETGKIQKSNLDSTHGIQYQKIKFNEHDIEFHVWDFGGQEYFHATHKLFFSPNALNIILWGQDVARENQVLESCFKKEYWLRIIEQLNKKDTSTQMTLLVENKVDLNPNGEFTPLNLNDISQAFPKLKLNSEYISLLSQINLSRLAETIVNTTKSNLINSYPSFYNTFWNRIQYLNKSTINIHEINERPSAINVESAMKVFHNMGMLLYFPDIIPEKVFVRPQELLNLLYNKVLMDKTKFKLTEQEISIAIQDNTLNLDKTELINLLKHFDLVFKIEKEPNTYYIPQYLPPRSPYLKKEINNYSHCSIKICGDNYLMSLAMLRLFFKYGKLVKENEDNSSSRENEVAYYFWKDGLIIEKDSQELRIEYNRSENCIELFEHKDINISNYKLQREIKDFILAKPRLHDGSIRFDGSHSHTGYQSSWESDSMAVLLSPNGKDFSTWKDIEKMKNLGALKVECKGTQTPMLDIRDFDKIIGNPPTTNRPIITTTPTTPSMQTIKIFLASSAELEADRDALRIFISVENDRLHSKGIYLQLVQWEYFLDAVADTRLQDEYNEAIKDCDILLSLFYTRAGKYTQEEFETALDLFKANGKPRIYTYFKDAPINTSDINEQVISLISFKKRLGELGHFPTNYKNIDDLKVQFKRQLEILLGTLYK